LISGDKNKGVKGMRGIITILMLLINTVGAYGVAFNMCRIDETGTIIGGPVDLDSQASVICKVSEAGYVYTYDESYIRCFDSGLQLINSVYQGSSRVSFSIDNLRNEIMTDRTIRRYGPLLDLIEEIEVPGYLDQLTVDPSDGAIWYTTAWPDERALYKVSYEGELIYYFPDYNNFMLTRVAPTGEFWASKGGDYIGITFIDSYGVILAEAPTVHGPYIEIYFGDLSCWARGGWNIITKVNADGSIIYNNTTDFNRPHDLAVDQDDGSVWIADTYNYDVVHLDQNGDELLRTDWDWVARAIAVDPTDSTVIVVSSLGDVSIEPASVGRIKALFK
jgi:hypothetical protein